MYNINKNVNSIKLFMNDQPKNNTLDFYYRDSTNRINRNNLYYYNANTEVI